MVLTLLRTSSLLPMTDHITTAVSLLGLPFADPRVSGFLQSLGESPASTCDAVGPLYEVRQHGFIIRVNKVTASICAFAFFLDGEQQCAEKESMAPYAGPLPMGILRTDGRASVLTKVSVPRGRTTLERGTLNPGNYYWSDWYYCDNVAYLFMFEATNDRLVNIQIIDIHAVGLDDDTTDFNPVELDSSDARTVCKQVAEVYANCRSYRDQGEVTVTFNPGRADSFVTRKLFRTYFRRPDRYLFEWVEVPEPAASTTTIDQVQEEVNAIWCIGDRYREHFLGSGRTLSNLQEAFTAQSGVSSGATCIIPPLLVKGITPPAHCKITEIPYVRFVPDPQPSDDPVISMSGMIAPDTQALLLIRKSTRMFSLIQTTTRQTVADANALMLAVLADLECNPAEHPLVIEQLRQRAGKDTEDTVTKDLYNYTNVRINEEIPDSSFEWTPYTYSEFEWLKRGLD
jgi:hypothetical protein